MDDAVIVALVNAGRTLKEITAETNVQRVEILRCCAIHKVLTRLRQNQTKPKVWPERKATAADAALVAALEAGKRPKEIAIEFGVSRQAIHQRIRKIGAVVPPRPKKIKISRVWGIPLEEANRLRDIGVLDAYRRQRQNARNRGIGWELTLMQWWDIWRESGRWEQRGRTKGCYVMGRPGDVGPYAVGNVVICSIKENIEEREKHSPAQFRLKNRLESGMDGGATAC